MEISEIRQLDQLIKLDTSKKLKSYKLTRLTAPGENYGSLILKLDITTTSQDGEEEEVNCVAKMLPPNQLLRKFFKVHVTFKNEIKFYTEIFPLLQNYQRQNGVKQVVNFVANLIGSRVNIQNDFEGEIDDDAVIILENLVRQGFRTVGRMTGFDLDAAKLVLKDLAALHAVPLAIKLKNPQLFLDKIKKYLSKIELPSDEENSFETKIKQDVTKILQDDPAYVEFIPRILKYLQMLKKGEVIPIREPFGTFTHRDLWVNNTMIRFENSKPVENKIIDFQVCEYGSPANDLIFFLFTSVRSSDLVPNIEYLIDYYYEHFINHLKELKCDTAPFSKDKFMDEIVLCVRESVLGHIVGMLNPIFAEKDDVKELSELKMEDFFVEKEFSKGHKDKLKMVVEEFSKRNWI